MCPTVTPAGSLLFQTRTWLCAHDSVGCFLKVTKGREPNPDSFLSDILGVCTPLMPGAVPGGTYMALLKASDLLL